MRRLLGHLTLVYHTHLKTRTQLIGEPIQEFAFVIEQMAHCALPSLHKDHIHRGASKAFVSGIKEGSVTWQLLLVDKKRPSGDL